MRVRLRVRASVRVGGGRVSVRVRARVGARVRVGVTSSQDAVDDSVPHLEVVHAARFSADWVTVVGDLGIGGEGGVGSGCHDHRICEGGQEVTRREERLVRVGGNLKLLARVPILHLLRHFVDPLRRGSHLQSQWQHRLTLPVAVVGLLQLHAEVVQYQEERAETRLRLEQRSALGESRGELALWGPQQVLLIGHGRAVQLQLGVS